MYYGTGGMKYIVGDLDIVQVIPVKFKNTPVVCKLFTAPYYITKLVILMENLIYFRDINHIKNLKKILMA